MGGLAAKMNCWNHGSSMQKVVQKYDGIAGNLRTSYLMRLQQNVLFTGDNKYMMKLERTAFNVP